MLRRERNSPRSGERLREPSQHHEISVKADPLQAADTKRGESVVVLQASELALNLAGALFVGFAGLFSQGHPTASALGSGLAQPKKENPAHEGPGG
jgi:hypothetical protein